MNTKLIAYPVLLTLVGSLSVANENTRRAPAKEMELVASYLSSLDEDARARLASKLYYLDPRLEKYEAKASLLDELKQQGRVKNDSNRSTGPRTVSCETGI